MPSAKYNVWLTLVPCNKLGRGRYQNRTLSFNSEPCRHIRLACLAQTGTELHSGLYPKFLVKNQYL